MFKISSKSQTVLICTLYGMKKQLEKFIEQQQKNILMTTEQSEVSQLE